MSKGECNVEVAHYYESIMEKAEPILSNPMHINHDKCVKLINSLRELHDDVKLDLYSNEEACHAFLKFLKKVDKKPDITRFYEKVIDSKGKDDIFGMWYTFYPELDAEEQGIQMVRDIRARMPSAAAGPADARQAQIAAEIKAYRESKARLHAHHDETMELMRFRELNQNPDLQLDPITPEEQALFDEEFVEFKKKGGKKRSHKHKQSHKKSHKKSHKRSHKRSHKK